MGGSGNVLRGENSLRGFDEFVTSGGILYEVKNPVKGLSPQVGHRGFWRLKNGVEEIDKIINF